MNLCNKYNFLVFLTVLVLKPELVFAEKLTLQEFHQLPMYCQKQKWLAAEYTKASSEQIMREYKLFESKFGSPYYHFHHWCWALVDINRYYSDFKNPLRANHLAAAIPNIDYVLNYTSESYFMLPEMLTRRGKVYSLLKQNGKAAADFTHAIRVNPKYGLAYVYYSDLYRESGQKDEAIKIIKAGLAADPKSDLLQKQLQRLK